MNTQNFWHNWLSTHLDLSPETIDQLVHRFEQARLVDDPETLERNQRTLDLACQLAKKVGLPEAQFTNFRRGVLLHDLGKLLIPLELLSKPGTLNPEEWAVLRRHTDYSYLLLCDIPELEPALDIPRHHHEFWDGSGYPLGLKGEDIPLAARLYSMIDVWDALISPRPFRPAFSIERARNIMVEYSGKAFEPALLSHFLQMLPES